MSDSGDQVARLLAEVKAAREGRDLWRKVAPTVRELRDLGVPFTEITQATGVSRSTIHRLAGGRSSSTTDK